MYWWVKENPAGAGFGKIVLIRENQTRLTTAQILFTGDTLLPES